MAKKSKLAVIKNKSGLVTKSDKSKKVSFLKTGAEVAEGDILELISGRASLKMLYGGSMDLPIGTPVQFSLIQERPDTLTRTKENDFQDKYIDQDFSNALIQSVLEVSHVSSYVVEQGLTHLSNTLLDEPQQAEKGEPINIDAVLAGSLNSRTSDIYSPYIQAIPKDTTISQQKASLQRITLLDKVIQNNRIVDSLLTGNDDIYKISNQALNLPPIKEINLHSPLVHLQSQKKIAILENIGEITASHVLQVNVASIGFIEGDQLVLENSDDLFFDINNNEVRIDNRVCMQFSLTQNYNDISYDFSGVGNKLLIKHLYERVLKSIYFAPSADESQINTVRNVSVQIIDDTGMAYHFVVQCQVEIDE